MLKTCRDAIISVVLKFPRKEREIVKLKGNTFTLQCTAKGVPFHHVRPVMRWIRERNDEPIKVYGTHEVIKNKDSSMTCKLSFTNANGKRHDGRYFCVYEARMNGCIFIQEFSSYVYVKVIDSKY
jgi:hypothetical protein